MTGLVFGFENPLGSFPHLWDVVSIFATIFTAMEAWYHYVLLVLTGFVVGFINTVAGGGSLITLPVLIFLGLPPSVANGTNRVGVVWQNVMGTLGFRSKGITTYPFDLYLGITALFGAILGATIALEIKGALFNRILAVIMVVVVLIIVFKPRIRMEDLVERTTGKSRVVAATAFFFFGIYGGFINAGLGFIIILFLHYVNQMTLVRANATKVSVVLIYSVAALIVFILNDKVLWEAGLVLAVGTGTGAWFASRISVDRGDGFIKTFLIVMVMVMAVKLWFFT